MLTSWTSSGTTSGFENVDLGVAGNTVELIGVLADSEWLSIMEVKYSTAHIPRLNSAFSPYCTVCHMLDVRSTVLLYRTQTGALTSDTGMPTSQDAFYGASFIVTLALQRYSCRASWCLPGRRRWKCTDVTAHKMHPCPSFVP